MVKACMKTVSQPKPPDIEHLSLVDADLKLKAKLKVSNQTNTELQKQSFSSNSH